MGRKGLQSRAIWQDYSGANAAIAEKSFFDVFNMHFSGTDFSVVEKPKDFTHIYVNVQLNENVLSAIYNPSEGITKHGITPDYGIRNSASGKTLYVEVKRQDGWVEEKPRSAGRGNAHERSNKYFTPGLLKALRKKGGLGENALPFWTVFQGDISRDPCRVREITLWYDDQPEHFFMWRDSRDSAALVDHFERHLKHLLV